MKRRCPICGNVFYAKSLKKIYCDNCLKNLRLKQNKINQKNRYMDNDIKNKKKQKAKEKFEFDNFNGLILGTTNFSGKRKRNFKTEQKIVKKQKNIVLKGRTYKNPKYLDLSDEKRRPKKKKSCKRKTFKSATIPKNINNVVNKKYYIDKIIEHFNLKVDDKDIIGVYKVELKSFNKYILFTKYKGRNIENIMYIKKGEDYGY